MNWLDSIKFNADGLIPAIAQDHKTERVLMVAWMNRESLRLTVESKTAVYFSRSRQKLWKKGETSGHIQQVHGIRLDCDADVLLLSVTQLGDIACHTGRQSCFYKELDLMSDEPSWQEVDPVLKDPADIYANIYKDGHSSDSDSANLHLHSPDSQRQSQQQVNTQQILQELDKILAERKTASADSSYVASLYHKGLNKILEKVGEESFEAVISAKDYQTALDDKLNDNSTKNNKAELKHDLVYEIADVWFHTMVTLAWFDIKSDVVLAELARRFGLSGIEEKASRG